MSTSGVSFSNAQKGTRRSNFQPEIFQRGHLVSRSWHNKRIIITKKNIIGSFISYISDHRFEMVLTSRNFMGPPSDWKTILRLTRYLLLIRTTDAPPLLKADRQTAASSLTTLSLVGLTD